MNKNVMIVLAGGFVVAILVAVLVQASLGGKKVSDNGPKTQVLVAAKDLSLGSELDATSLKWQTWPGEKAFAGAIIRKEEQKPEDALKGRLIQRVSAGQPMLQSYIFKEGKGNVVAAMLDKGMRAVAIPVKVDTMAGGFVVPGDNVDVILTYKVDIERDQKTAETDSYLRSYASETILKNVKVLAVDQDTSREEDKAKIARTVTLSVDTKGAEKVALAAEMGDLTLSLRGIGDDVDMNPDAITTDVEVSRAMQKIDLMNNGGSGGGPVKIYNGAIVSEIRPRGSVVSTVSDTNEAEVETQTTSPVITSPAIVSEPTEGVQ